MKNNEEDFTNRKENRRKKIKTKNTYREFDTDDPVEKRAKKNLEYKKYKEEFLEEDWEDWDRYYNH